MTPAWERIWCAEEKSVHHGKAKDFVPEPEYFNLPPLGLVGWHYMGEFITAEEARTVYDELGIEVPEELKQYLPLDEDREDLVPRITMHPSTTIQKRRHSDYFQSSAGGEFLVILLELPYFMTNESWYYIDKKDGRLRLTDAAPPEARKSYEEDHELLEKMTVRSERDRRGIRDG